MSENINQDDISLIDLYKILWKKKIYILLTSFSVAVACLFYANSLEDIYRSKTLLAPSSDSDSAPSMGMLSGVASIAGINIPSNSSANNVLISIERLKSLDFFEMVVDKHSLYYELEAVNGWNSANNTLIVNTDIYDDKKNQWISDDEFAINGRPSIQKIHANFLENFSVYYDNKNGFVSLSVDHFSPHVAKKILEIFIKEINETTRKEDISTAQQIISYLEEENLNTRNIDLKLGINSLIQSQIKKIAIANSSPQYVLKVISPPYAPESKFSPSRSLIVLIGFFLGSIFSSMFFIFYRIYLNESNSTEE
ncbi:MAG: Wzz/FepE/Etk N-terminal domain-containing protein [Gammaproteobacteria bacterium]